MTKVRSLLVLGAMLAAALVIAACGSDSSSSDSGGTIIRGTTDQPISYDPAGAYDLPSYDGIYSMYQNLLTVEPGGNKAVPDAAESCDFTDQDNKVFECTLKPGLKFSDGSDLTAEDVVFSFERNIEIADPNGASSLLANMKSIEAKGDDTVVFNLKEPDATWPLLLTTGSFAIVPSDVYPADKLQPSDQVVGSGRYTLADYQPGQQTVMEKNDAYQGADPAKNDRVIIQYFDKASALKLAVAERRRRHRLPQPQPDRHRRPRGRRRRSAWSPATAPRSATWSSTRSSSPATTTPRSWRSARRSRRRSTARRSPTTSTTAPSSRSTRWSRRASSTRPRRSPTSTARAPTSTPPSRTLAGRRRRHAGAARGLVDALALRRRLRRRVRGDQAPARRQRPVRRDAEVDRVEPVLEAAFTDKYPHTSSAGSRTIRTPTTTRRRSTCRTASSTSTTTTRR